MTGSAAQPSESNLDDHHNYSDRRPAVGVGVMVRRGDAVLLGRRRGAHGAGAYGWPGGGLAFGESLMETVRREAREEAGLIVERARFICVSNVVEYGRHYLDLTFEVTEFEGQPTRREADFTDGWRWYPLNDLPSPLFKPCQLAIESLNTLAVINDSE